MDTAIQNNTAQEKRSGLLGKVKSVLTVTTIVGLLLTNVATLTNDHVHTQAFTGLEPVKGDPDAKEDWYTPARYFLRQYLQANPSHRKFSIEKLAEKVAPMLTEKNIGNQRNGKPLAASTIRKAFSNVKY